MVRRGLGRLCLDAGGVAFLHCLWHRHLRGAGIRVRGLRRLCRHPGGHCHGHSGAAARRRTGPDFRPLRAGGGGHGRHGRGDDQKRQCLAVPGAGFPDVGGLALRGSTTGLWRAGRRPFHQIHPLPRRIRIPQRRGRAYFYRSTAQVARAAQ